MLSIVCFTLSESLIRSQAHSVSLFHCRPLDYSFSFLLNSILDFSIKSSPPLVKLPITTSDSNFQNVIGSEII